MSVVLLVITEGTENSLLNKFFKSPVSIVSLSAVVLLIVLILPVQPSRYYYLLVGACVQI